MTPEISGTEEAQAVNVALLPCPFCGPGQSQVGLWHDDVAKRWRVGCGRCGSSTGFSARDKSQAPAIAAWNYRGGSFATPDAAALLAKLNKGIPEKCIGKGRHGDRIIDYDHEAAAALLSEAASLILSQQSKIASQSSTIASAREVIEQIAEGSIDVSETAIILGRPKARDVLGAAREWKER